MRNKRTDIAAEACEMAVEEGGAIPEGVASREYDAEGLHVRVVEVQTQEGAEKLDKPIGRYVTIDIDPLIDKQSDAFVHAVNALASELSAMSGFDSDGQAMVVGLGNRQITPDSIGPKAVNMVIATRHLIEQMPEEFKGFRPVTALSPGVLGTTGIETGEIVTGIVQKTSPGLLVLIDALASRHEGRLCRTIQLSDTGVTPGSGVGNNRFAINRETIGIPCVAVGVPTVVDAATLAADIMDKMKIPYSFDSLREQYGNTFVTLKEIDIAAAECAKVIAYGINKALQKSLSIEDIEMFLS